MLYNTAMSVEGKVSENMDYELKEKYHKENRCYIFNHNMCDIETPSEFELADVMYAEISWEHGFDKFREKYPFEGTYKDYIFNMAILIKELNIPAFIPCGKSAFNKLNQIVGNGTLLGDYKLRSTGSLLAVFNVDNPQEYENVKTVEELFELLKDQYDCVLDVSSGYGQHLLQFKQFIATDINNYCLGYLKECVEREGEVK